ncbi:MAG TPA: hypothetical protein VJT72_10225 [Pseudonocardiaceae bacterium]|nr:hypothetical protein [Pseudonocardiaceae bacterium]
MRLSILNIEDPLIRRIMSTVEAAVIVAGVSAILSLISRISVELLRRRSVRQLEMLCSEYQQDPERGFSGAGPERLICAQHALVDLLDFLDPDRERFFDFRDRIGTTTKDDHP